MSKIGFIGCGNMGGALIRAAAKVLDPKDILITDTDTAKGEALAAETGACFTDAAALAGTADMIFLGVKPQVMEGMLGGIASILASRTDHFVLVTMAASLSMARIRAMAGGEYPIIRIMPNLAASVGEGMILYTSEGTEEEELALFCTVLSKAGRLLPIKENLIDAGSAISGCGPAFVCMMAEALADAGVAIGLTRANALLLAEQTLLGTAKQLMETGVHPEALKDAVCSPGGTTIAGVLAAEKAGFRDAASDAVLAAYKRTVEMR